MFVSSQLNPKKMPFIVPKGYKPKTYVVKETLHDKLLKRALRDKVTLTEAVNAALEAYLTTTKGKKAAPAKKAAKK